MKKVKIYITIALSIFATACLKDKPNVDFTTISPIAEISSSNINPTPNAPSSGLDYFNAATLPYIGADTTFNVTFDVNIASEFPPTKDVTVTLAINDSKRTAYNSNLAPEDQYVLPADSNYSFPIKTAIIKAGSRLAKFTVTFFGLTLDPAKNYMLPITLTDASGVTISGNLSTIYIHSIGNPNAGAFSVTGTRTNYTGSSSGGVVASVVDLSTLSPKTATPENGTVINIYYANLGPSHYIITFNADGTALTNVVVDSDFAASVSNFGIDLFTYDLASKTIHIKSHYTNSVGNDRVIEEFFTHQ
jgi:hypothetical protein